MERHFEHELEGLRTSLIKMGTMVEESFRLAVKAVVEHDRSAAQGAVVADERIDMLELEIDNAIIDLLALQQPVAKDLRFIIASQKLNNDLERIGDHAVNIAQSALTLAELSGTASMGEITQMLGIVGRMLRDALDAFIRLDSVLAEEVLQVEDRVDDLNRSMAKTVIGAIKANAMSIETGMELARISRNLERVADLSTNISEEVVFLAQARVIKHHAEAHRSQC